jgi:hypothetical protein
MCPLLLNPFLYKYTHSLLPSNVLNSVLESTAKCYATATQKQTLQWSSLQKQRGTEKVYTSNTYSTFLLLFASCYICITNNSMSFLPSTQHLFNSHHMFWPQRVIRCYKHMVLKLHRKSLTFSSLASNCWSTYLHFLHSVGLIVLKF